MNSRPCWKIDSQYLPVGLQLLFHRLLTEERQTSENLTDISKYELCNRPPALFDHSELLRDAKKLVLADAICSVRKGVDMPAALPTPQMKYVLDGRSFLYRPPWPRGATFDSICTMYVDYVETLTRPTILFDGYEIGPSRKDTTHLRPSGGVMGAKVNFDSFTPVALNNTSWLMQTASSGLGTCFHGS